MGIIQQIESAQTIIHKEEQLIELLKEEVKNVVTPYLSRIACSPKDNITTHAVTNVETVGNTFKVTVVVYFARNPAIKTKQFNEEIILDIPELYLDYINVLSYAVTLKTLSSAIDSGRTELAEFLEYQINKRLMDKFVIPNINRILAEG